ncbi:hypothetical protein VT84_37120 [Gemmata sp. SH-PL17]|nr:hypothetical protein VT84_37120 [Gemmata sp. SH-PL17]
MRKSWDGSRVLTANRITFDAKAKHQKGMSCSLEKFMESAGSLENG